jgi:hypothetical protein
MFLLIVQYIGLVHAQSAHCHVLRRAECRCSCLRYALDDLKAQPFPFVVADTLLCALERRLDTLRLREAGNVAAVGTTEPFQSISPPGPSSAQRTAERVEGALEVLVHPVDPHRGGHRVR